MMGSTSTTYMSTWQTQLPAATSTAAALTIAWKHGPTCWPNMHKATPYAAPQIQSYRTDSGDQSHCLVIAGVGMPHMQGRIRILESQVESLSLAQAALLHKLAAFSCVQLLDRQAAGSADQPAKIFSPGCSCPESGTLRA